MPHNVVVSLFSQAYDQTQFRTYPIALRLQILHGTLRKTREWINLHSGDLNPSIPFKGVYLAPEYYFTQPHAENRRVPMSEEERVQLEPELLALSAQFPEILIAPGTIYFAKPLHRTAISFQHKFDPATGMRTLLKTSQGDRRGRALQRLQTHVDTVYSLKTDADPAFWTSWDERGYNAGSHAVPALREIRASFQSPRNKPGTLRNSAYILLGRQRIAKYDKQTDWGEALGNSPDDLAFIPGVQKQCPEVGGYRVGMEVCADHANGMLARRHVTPLHFHFVVSDFVGNCVGNMSMSAGGYFAHASSNHKHTCLWWRSPQGAPTDITQDTAYWKHTQGCPGSMLDGYLVPLPAPLTPPIPQNFRALLNTSG